MHLHVWRICVTWLIHTCDMTHLYMSQICVTWLIRTCGVCMYTWAVRIVMVLPISIIHTCDLTHLHVWRICVTWLIHACDKFVWHDSFVHVVYACIRGQSELRLLLASFVCVTWLIYTSDVYVWHDSCICVTNIHDITHSCMWRIHVYVVSRDCIAD